MDLRVRLDGSHNGLNSIVQSLRKHMIQSIIQNHGWRNVFYTVNRYNKRSVTLWLHKYAVKYKNVLLFTKCPWIIARGTNERSVVEHRNYSMLVAVYTFVRAVHFCTSAAFLKF